MSMIDLVSSVPVGNALRLYLTPPVGALHLRVLRRTADAFVGPDDAGAVLVADTFTDNMLVDVVGLANGSVYFYRAYAWDGSSWAAGATVSGTPAATYRDDFCDPLMIMLTRLKLGLVEEVRRQNLRPQSGAVQVTNAPFLGNDAPAFPTVSVHLESEAPELRGIGEMVTGALHNVADWTDEEGWVARTRLNIVGVSLNPDERLALRLSIKRILQANFSVWDSLGLMMVEWTSSDNEDTSSFNAPLYFTTFSFSCLSSFELASNVDEVTDITVTSKELFA